MSPRSSAALLSTPDPESPYLRVPIDALVESPLNPRKRIDPQALSELAESIRLHDVIAPIVVRMCEPRTATEIRYEIVAGSRRYRAAQLVGLSSVPVLVRDVTDAQLLELALQENIQRATMSPLEEGRALDTLAELDPIYRDDRVLASKIGRSETYVRDRRKLLRLDETVIRALEAEAITAKHAERIARLPQAQHGAALRACFARLFVSDAEYQTLVDNDRWRDLAPQLVGLREFDAWADRHATVDVTAPDVQRDLRPALEELFTSAHVDDDELDEAHALATAEMLRLSEDADYQFTRKDAKALAVIRASDWKAITRDKDGCEFARPGVIVHGGPTRILDRVCVDKRHCAKHWPKPVVSKADANRADREAKDRADRIRAEEARRAEQAKWDAERSAFTHAFGALLAKKALSPVAVARAVTAAHDAKTYLADFGLTLTDKTALAFLLLRGVNTSAHSRKFFVDQAVTFCGFTEKQVRAEMAAQAPKTGSAAKKTRAKKGGRK